MPQVPADYRVLEHSHRKSRTGAKRTSAANPNEVLTVSVRVRRRSGAPPLPDLLSLAAKPHRDRRYHSREDFGAQYGASQEDLDKVAQFAHAHGLSVVESSIPRRTVVLKGTVAQMNKAFVVDLGTYETADEKYRGREGPIHVPHAIYGIVEGVFGLDNRKMANPHIRSGMKSPAAVSPVEDTAPMTPPRVAQLYHFPMP